MYRMTVFRWLSLAALAFGVALAVWKRPRITVGTEPGDPTIYPIVDPRTWQVWPDGSNEYTNPPNVTWPTVSSETWTA